MTMNGSEFFLLFDGRPVAKLSPATNAFDIHFEYLPSWIASGFPLAPSLPFENIPQGAALAFLENMLPEGKAFERLVAYHSLSRNHVLALALAIRNDLSGALTLSPTPTQEIRNSTFRSITEEEIIARLEKPETQPMDIWDNRPRLSVAGVQTKLNVLKRGETYGLVDGTNLCSDRILKFESKAQRHLLLNEYLTMTLAKSLPHQIADCHLIHFGEFRALEILRFDRRVQSEDRVLRRHVIDVCQALGLPSGLKYERNFGDGKDVRHIRDGVSFNKLLSLTNHCREPLSVRTMLFDWLIFNLIVGNSDAHGKNFSFFASAKGLTPTPWYDLISVLQVEDIEHSLAMSVGDEFNPNEIHALQLLIEADEVGLTKTFVQERLKKVLDCLNIGLANFTMSKNLNNEEKEFAKKYFAFIQKQIARWRQEEQILKELTI